MLPLSRRERILIAVQACKSAIATLQDAVTYSAVDDPETIKQYFRIMGEASVGLSNARSSLRVFADRKDINK